MHDTGNRPMAPIRVLIVDLPPLVADFMAQELEEQPDMQLTRAKASAQGLDDGELRGAFDVVLTSIEGLRARNAPHGLPGVNCPIPVIGISRDGRRAELHDIMAIREVSVQAIVAVLRDVANAGGLPWMH